MILYRFTGFNVDFYTPLDFYTYHINRFRESDSLIGFLNSTIYNLQSGSAFPILALGISNPVLSISNNNTDFLLSLVEAPGNKRVYFENIVAYIFFLDNSIEPIQFVIEKISKNIPVEISCNMNDQCIVNKSKINKTYTGSGVFPVSKYSAFYLKHDKIIVFERPKGLQIRGIPVVWDPIDPYYRITNLLGK